MPRSERGRARGPQAREEGSSDGPERRSRLGDRRARRSRPHRRERMHERRISPRLAGSASPAASTGGGDPERCPSGSAAAGTKHVSIVNKDMTDDEIKAAIAGRRRPDRRQLDLHRDDELVNQFQKYVKDTYGVDIKLTYVGSQAPSEYLTKLAAPSSPATRRPTTSSRSRRTTGPTRIDQDLVDDFLPSDLVPNQKLLLARLQARADRVAFQAASFTRSSTTRPSSPGSRPSRTSPTRASRARSRCRRPATSRRAGFLLALATELGKDYKDPEQMKEVVDWVDHQHRPERPASTPDQPSSSSCSSRARPTPWSSGTPDPARVLRRQQDVAQVVPPALFPQRLPVDPEEGAAPGARPDLHQLAPCARRSSSPTTGPSSTARGASSARASSVRLREPHPGLVQGRLLQVLPDPRPDQVQPSDDRLEGLQRQLPRSSRTTTPRSSGSRHGWRMAAPARRRGGRFHPRHLRPIGSPTLSRRSLAPELRRRERRTPPDRARC